MKCLLCSSADVRSFGGVSLEGKYSECCRCKLIWLEPGLRLPRAEEEARYRTHNNETSDPRYIAYLRRTAAPILARFPHGARGLDYGCGPTEGMGAVLPEFSVGSYDPIFFPHDHLLKNRYDFVICSEAAEHFYAPAEEFARLASLLHPGGYLVVRTEFAVEEKFFPDWFYRRDPTHVVFYQPETARWIAETYGFRVEELENPLWVFQKLSSGGRNLA